MPCARLARLSGQWGRPLSSVTLVLSLVCARGLGYELPATCGGAETADWTSASHTAKGYHVLCIEDLVNACHGGDSGTDSASCKAGSHTDGQVSIGACWGGRRDTCEQFAFASPEELLQLEAMITARSPLANPTRHQRIQKAKEKKGQWKGLFAFFAVNTPEGMPTRIKRASALTGLVLAFEGGTFIWPGVDVGYKRQVTIQATGAQDELKLELITKSLRPLILEVSSFLDSSECKHIIEKATPHVAKSAVSHMDHDVGKPATNWRSSSTYFMRSDDDALRLMDRRVASLTVTNVENQEYAQVLRYGTGERYAAHHDYFDIKNYANNGDIMQLTTKGIFNRLATVFFYLTDVERGGHTNFPRAGGLPQPNDFEDCSKGVSISPQEGRIIVFYSLDPSAGLDDLSLHSGCQVLNGTKWSVNKWIWNKRTGF